MYSQIAGILLLTYYSLFLEQSDIVNFEVLFNNIKILGIFLFIIHIKTNNASSYINVTFSAACRGLLFVSSVILEVNCTMGLKTG